MSNLTPDGSKSSKNNAPKSIRKPKRGNTRLAPLQDVGIDPASDLKTRTVHVTFFPNKQAFSMYSETPTLEQLAYFIGMQSETDKMRLPWLKLQRFGGRRSPKNCLRNNANVLAVSGIEAEHDAGKVAFETAVATMRAARIRCLLYTSPSWVEGVKEKWRILLPLSCERPPELHAKLVARVNGLFDGAITDECFVLSQAYLFGHIGDAPHREVVLDGDFIDLRDDLDQGAKGKRVNPKANRRRIIRERPASRERDGSPGRNEAEIMEELRLSIEPTRYGENQWHNRMLSATASMVMARWTDEEIYEAAAPYCWEGKYDPEVEEMVESARKKWNAPDPNPDWSVGLLGDFLRKRREMYGDNWQYQDTMFRKPDRAPDAGPAKSKRPPPQWLDMSNWDHERIPERQWAIPDCVPLKQVGLFSGEGGTGKSIVEIMKNIAHVAGKQWLGLQPVQGGAFYLGAEDDIDELHIRLAVIARHYGVTFEALIAGGLHVLPLLGEDAVLCAINPRSGRVETTELYDWVYEQAGDLKPKNISVDTLSRAFAGSEIDRSQVYGFAMHMQALAKVACGSVTVLSHPSLAGMASGSGLSGSTAWHGAFRFRQYLSYEIAGDDDNCGIGPPDNGLRLLEFKKNQYGPLGTSLTLRYCDGLFLPEIGATDAEKLARSEMARQIFLQLLERLDGQGRNVGHSPKSNNYAPTMFAKEAEVKNHSLRKADMEAAMSELFAAGRLLVEHYGRPSRPMTRLVVKA